MTLRETLPTREEVNELDADTLEEIKDEIELRIADIETQLEFPSAVVSDDWEGRARRALTLHRYTERIIWKRLKKLEAEAATSPRHRRTSFHALTLAAMRELPGSNPASVLTTEEADAEKARLLEFIDAIEGDRDDEKARKPHQRDHTFLADSTTAVRALRANVQLIQNRRGEITKAKTVAERGDESTRERLFINAAREVLDRNTYLSIWGLVDAALDRVAEAA